MMSVPDNAPGAGVIIPDSFRLAHYRLALEAIDPLRLKPVKSNTLRGGFGHTFKRLACRQPWPCENYCQAGNRCAHGYIFETSPPEQAEVLRNFQNVPRPFVIAAPVDDQTLVPPGQTLTFTLVLIGRAIDYRSSFEAVFRELGRVGLGKSRGKYRLRAMELSETYDAARIMARAESLPLEQISLEFLTPVRLKQRGRWVNEGPPFAGLANKLLSRISSLSYFHCGQRLETDFRGLIDRAAGVDIVQSDTRWENWSRFSGRQKQRIEMGGLIGPVTYRGDLRPYRPILALGELLHVGKGTVFGNGQYRIETAAKLT